MNANEILSTVSPVVAILGILAIGGWIFTTWLRVKNGYPLENSWGKAVYPKTSDEAMERVKLISQENAQLRAELGSVKDRLAVVERIVTDEGHRVAAEIEALYAVIAFDQLIEVKQRGHRGLGGTRPIHQPHRHRFSLALDRDPIQAVTGQPLRLGQTIESALADQRLPALGAIAEAGGDIDRIAVAITIMLDNRATLDARLDTEPSALRQAGNLLRQHLLHARSRFNRGQGVVEQDQHTVAKVFHQLPASEHEVTPKGMRTARNDARGNDIARCFEQTGATRQVGKYHGPHRLLHATPRSGS